MIRTLVTLAAALLAFTACEYEDDTVDELGAQDVCEQFVEDQLRSPSTAEFSGADVANVDGDKWAVRGVVDSQNGFGAVVRNEYRCVVVKTGGNDDASNWRLKQLTGLVN